MKTLSLNNLQVLLCQSPFAYSWGLLNNVICKELTVEIKKDFNTEYVKLIHEEYTNFYYTDCMILYIRTVQR